MNSEHETKLLNLPVLPLKNSLAFPGVVIPVSVGRLKSVAAVEAALATEDKQIAVVTQLNPLIEDAGVENLHTIGTMCIVKRMHKEENSIHLILQGSHRIERVQAAQEEPFLQFQVSLLAELDDLSPEVEALQRTLLEQATKMLALGSPAIQVDLRQLVYEIEQPVRQAYVLCSLASIDIDKQYRLLTAGSQLEALQLAVDFITHEVQVLEVQKQISSAVHSQMSEEQREMMLRRQLREIQQQLGDESPERAEVAELRRLATEAELPELARKEIDRELERLERMSSSSPDYQTSRSYIDLVLNLPWNKTTEDNLDLARSRQILDEDHFDLEEVKDRIIEHLAVMKLNPGAKAPILCFSGPPGVGKTSLGQSIARALGRVFERMSLGGLHDEAELRGHRRTYVGAMPGRIIRSVRRAGVKNPLLMLDEIDKLGRDFRGDPAAALMEILDPAQNSEFLDNYLDLPFDLSRIFFIATANTLDTIPAPLLDRIEVLRLAGYTEAEKREIARRYILGRRLEEAGLKQGQLLVDDDALDYVIRNHTREAGVRSLERALGRIARKVATRVAQGDSEPVNLTSTLIKDFLGPPRMAREARRESLQPGVVAGLAWTEAGGDVLYVEAVVLPEGSDLTLTGQLGSVMQESARAALSYLWSQADMLGIDKERMHKSGIHIHVPAGATPKDGPSAGITMAVALASALADMPVRDDTAMTGEITLSGLVLPVGGIKEKMLAAHRAGFRRVILPAGNEPDLIELPDTVRDEMNFILAERIGEVFIEAIPGLGVGSETGQKLSGNG
jgi:ATP-dependent Lon protease